MSKHTPEPWHVDTEIWTIEDSAHNPACIASLAVRPERQANARRIVAAVNACRDLITEELEEEPNLYALRGMVNAGNEVRAQRDELLAAAEVALELLRSHAADADADEVESWAVDKLEAAVARARGEAPPAKETP